MSERLIAKAEDKRTQIALVMNISPESVTNLYKQLVDYYQPPKSWTQFIQNFVLNHADPKKANLSERINLISRVKDLELTDEILRNIYICFALNTRPFEGNAFMNVIDARHPIDKFNLAFRLQAINLGQLAWKTAESQKRLWGEIPVFETRTPHLHTKT